MTVTRDGDAQRPRVRVIHGPNLNLLGEREPGLYGDGSLAALDAALVALAAELAVDVDIHQSNLEGVLVELVQGCRGARDGLIINPAGYTHTSIALQDALRSVGEIPVVEVHLTNLYARELVRQTSVTGVVCSGVIMGLGLDSYLLALKHVAGLVSRV